MIPELNEAAEVTRSQACGERLKGLIVARAKRCEAELEERGLRDDLSSCLGRTKAAVLRLYEDGVESLVCVYRGYGGEIKWRDVQLWDELDRDQGAERDPEERVYVTRSAGRRIDPSGIYEREVDRQEGENAEQPATASLRVNRPTDLGFATEAEKLPATASLVAREDHGEQ